ncbi:MAG: hypothetical protein P8X54_03810 [Desulfuromonadales bacterium]
MALQKKLCLEVINFLDLIELAVKIILPFRAVPEAEFRQFFISHCMSVIAGQMFEGTVHIEDLVVIAFDKNHRVRIRVEHFPETLFTFKQSLFVSLGSLQ